MPLKLLACHQFHVQRRLNLEHPLSDHQPTSSALSRSLSHNLAQACLVVEQHRCLAERLAITDIMRISDEIKARLNYGVRELSQTLQLLATVTEHIQTAFDETQVCSDRAGLIDPAIDALNHQVQTLTEEMDRVYSLRNDESDLYLRQENTKLKRDFAALQQALRHELEKHRTYIVASTKSNEELVQRIGNLERFNQLLKSRLNEMKDKYESAIIEIADLKDMNNTLQNASGKYRRGQTPSLDSTDDLQHSMSLPILPLLAISIAAP